MTSLVYKFFERGTSKLLRFRHKLMNQGNPKYEHVVGSIFSFFFRTTSTYYIDDGDLNPTLALTLQKWPEP